MPGGGALDGLVEAGGEQLDGMERPGGGDEFDDLVARLALVALPGFGPARQRWVLSGAGPAEVVRELRAGRLPVVAEPAPPGVTSALVARWQREIRSIDGRALLAELRDHQVAVRWPGQDGWPFDDDPEPPMLLFSQGDGTLVGRRHAVAIVGTRRCSAIGREVATMLGSGLAEAGVAVVSGLATGVDGAAHHGVVRAGGPAIAVVGSGLDVIYPRANARLWNQVRASGVVVSEAALGQRPARWRFPARNRLIAALADIVVVVESHDRGGSLSTVAEAADRGRLVMAVPGAVTNPAAAGTNQLLIDGCPPVCSVYDILDALGSEILPASTASGFDDGEPDRGGDNGPESGAASPLERRIVAEVSAADVHVDQLVTACRVPIPEILATINELERRGVVEVHGSTVIRRPGGRAHQPALSQNHQETT